MTLTADQQVVADAVLKKLFEGKEQEIIISGPAGTGKSFLINYITHNIIDKYAKVMKLTNTSPKFLHEEPLITATTNKAVGVLASVMTGPVATIESALNLIVKGDYSKGEYKLTPAPSGLNIITDSIVIIDEASMIDKTLYGFIRQGCIGCFIIYIGDACQLPAVREGNTPLVFSLGLPEYKLTSLVRQADNEEIAELCNTMRKTVQTGQFKNIVTNKSITQVNEEGDRKRLLIKFNYEDGKILTYTNKKAIQYNDWLMSEKHGTRNEANLYENELYVVNEFFKDSYYRFRISAETTIKVTNILEPVTGSYNGATCEFQHIYAETHSGRHKLLVPTDKEYYFKWLKFIAKHKDWKTYFHWKESVIDIRGNYASTIHKAQGSTFNHVIIDADDFKSCTNPAIAARLLYVAVSRAKHEITFFGSLPKKYGEIICQQPMCSRTVRNTPCLRE